jgi:hypothetical protein
VEHLLGVERGRAAAGWSLQEAKDNAHDSLMELLHTEEFGECADQCFVFDLQNSFLGLSRTVLSFFGLPRIRPVCAESSGAGSGRQCTSACKRCGICSH